MVLFFRRLKRTFKLLRPSLYRMFLFSERSPKTFVFKKGRLKIESACLSKSKLLKINEMPFQAPTILLTIRLETTCRETMLKYASLSFTSKHIMTAAIEHVQAAAFDLDGTLCDSVPDLAAAAEAMREYLGMEPLPAKTVESYVGDGIGKLVHRVITDDRDQEAAPDLWEKGFVFYMKYYRDHLSDFTRPYPETAAGLALLKSLGIPLVVITNKNEILAAELLKQLGLADYFSLILGGDSLPEKKPSPLPLQHAAEVLGIDPANMIMVGDSRNDIIAAKAAGCLSVGVTFGYGDMTLLSQDKATKPDWIIGSLPEIYENLRPKKAEDDE